MPLGAVELLISRIRRALRNLPWEKSGGSAKLRDLTEYNKPSLSTAGRFVSLKTKRIRLQTTSSDFGKGKNRRHTDISSTYKQKQFNNRMWDFTTAPNS